MGTKKTRMETNIHITFMVHKYTDVVFSDNTEFKGKPREFLTEHIYNILSAYKENDTPDENKVKTLLGLSIAYEGSEHFKKVYNNFDKNNIYKSVYLCMEFWDLDIQNDVLQFLIDANLKNKYINKIIVTTIQFICKYYVGKMLKEIENVKIPMNSAGVIP